MVCTWTTEVFVYSDTEGCVYLQNILFTLNNKIPPTIILQMWFLYVEYIEWASPVHRRDSLKDTKRTHSSTLTMQNQKQREHKNNQQIHLFSKICWHIVSTLNHLFNHLCDICFHFVSPARPHKHATKPHDQHQLKWYSLRTVHSHRGRNPQRRNKARKVRRGHWEKNSTNWENQPAMPLTQSNQTDQQTPAERLNQVRKTSAGGPRQQARRRRGERGKPKVSS